VGVRVQIQLLGGGHQLGLFRVILTIASCSRGCTGYGQGGDLIRGETEREETRLQTDNAVRVYQMKVSVFLRETRRAGVKKTEEVPGVRNNSSYFSMTLGTFQTTRRTLKRKQGKKKSRGTYRTTPGEPLRDRICRFDSSLLGILRARRTHVGGGILYAKLTEGYSKNEGDRAREAGLDGL